LGGETWFSQGGEMIINRDRSVIPACDVPDQHAFEYIVAQTKDIDGIGGYKVGFELGLKYGLSRISEIVHSHSDKPIIYDHQKAGTDIPNTGKNFARVCSDGGVDAVILFPQAGPETEKAWISAAHDAGLGVIVGGRMTHKAYAQSEGGWISDEGAMDMYRIAAKMGVNDFVVPGNKPDVIRKVRKIIEAERVVPVFYAPGFIAQGGDISESAKVAGDKFHGIVGRGIYEADDINAAALKLTSQL
jgi:orotidine-5'-phosphate decarboxylase